MSQQSILAAIKSITDRFDVPLLIISTIIQVESAWNPNALGDNGTSYGLFQLHTPGGQGDNAIRDGYKPTDLFDPIINARYAMPSIAQAWDNLKASFNVNNLTWWLDFAAQSGHPGGDRTNQTTINEASMLQRVYSGLDRQGGSMSVPLNAHGEVADFVNVSQFENGESEYACGFFACAMVAAMGQPGHGPTHDAEWVDQLADRWYEADNGPNTADNTSGMSLEQLYGMLRGLRITYQPLPITAFSDHNSDIAHIKASLALGCPVIIAGTETGMFDLDLNSNPYNWTPSGNHIITITGVAPDGNLLVHDPASIGPNGVRPGPRRYANNHLFLISGTAIIPPWKGAISMPIPDKWSDDGKTLKAPNGHTVVKGFRDHILNAASWASWDMPLQEEEGRSQVEESNPALGSGTRQIFNGHLLEWTQAKGVFEGYIGQELLYVLQDRAKVQAELKKAQAQLAATQQPPVSPPGVNPATQTAIKGALALLEPLVTS